MMATGDASNVGSYRTRNSLPLVCRPYRVPFLLNLPGRGQRVSGELYAVSQRALEKMDELEGLRRGHYERLAIELVRGDDEEEKRPPDPTPAHAYYAHRSYAEEMLKKNGKEGYNNYTEKVARGYVKIGRKRLLSWIKFVSFFLNETRNLSSIMFMCD